MNATLLKVDRKTARCTATEARELFAAIPAKAQRSLPGHALATIIDTLSADGTAELAATLALLFPNEPLDKARRRLTTEIANRVYVDETGTAPLKISQTRKGVEPSLIWLERLDLADVRGLTEAGDRYAPDQFVPSEATQKTSAEIVGEIASPNEDQLPPSVGEGDLADPKPPVRVESGNEAFVRAASNHVKFNQSKPDNAGNDSLRGVKMPEQFTATEAEQTVGFPGISESTYREPKNTVNALDAMLAWASDSTLTAPKLLALLGDYGTGKTSHALQFSRVLNGDIAHPKRPDATLSALHIDLAYLRGAPGLAHLNVMQIVSMVIDVRGLSAVLDAEVVVREVREGRRILVYDGLDELMQSDHAQLHSVFRQLLQVLEPDPVTREPSRARLIVSCRTHYFRDLTEQHEFFNTRLRHSVTRKDYLCLYLLKWKPATVRDYLSRRLTPVEASALSETIANTYDLEQLASRPVLLAMMCEQVGEVLRLRDAGGGAVTASTLYAQTVAMWVRRDDEKHVLQATHKTVLMGALACAMWNDGKEYWEADRLDRWLRKTVDALFPRHYSPEQTQAIQDDLRTATFIVRPGQQGFTFAHRSFMEFFLARHLVTLMDWEDLPEITLRTERTLLPERNLSRESLKFLSELLSLRSDLKDSRAQRFWTWLSYGGGGESLDENAEIPAPADKCHGVLFRTACELRLDAPPAVRRANLRFVDLDELEARGLRLPPLDVRRARLRGIRLIDCGVTSIWATHADLHSATFRDCEIEDLLKSRATTEGLLVRQRASTPTGFVRLDGPWQLPMTSTHASLELNRTGSIQRVYADDDITVVLVRETRLYCWDTVTGQVRWQSYSRVRDPSFQGVWSLDNGRACIVHLVRASGEAEQFELGDGSHSVVLLRVAALRSQVAPLLTLRQRENALNQNVTGSVQSYQIEAGQLAGCTRYFVHGKLPSTACFDAEGSLVDYDEEAADTWLRYLGNGYPQPVEAAWLELNEMGRSLGPKKPRD